MAPLWRAGWSAGVGLIILNCTIKTRMIYFGVATKDTKNFIYLGVVGTRTPYPTILPDFFEIDKLKKNENDGVLSKS